MKFHIPAQLLVQFRTEGHIELETSEISFGSIQKEIKSQRDSFRKSPFLKKFIIHTLGPIALELTKQTSLRLACDQWFEKTPQAARIQDLFCFQELSVIFVISSNNDQIKITVLEPSSLCSFITDHSYLIAFAQKNARIIENFQDPYAATTRNLGYVYGDTLKNPLHPLIFS